MSKENQDLRYENFNRLFYQYERNIRAFVASILPNWEGVDEVMQESSIVLWKKFDQFDDHGDSSSFLGWAFTIARYEVLKFRRKKATDRHVFSEDIFDLLMDEAEEVAEVQKDREKALQGCLVKLNDSQRELLKAAYEDGISIKEAAVKVGRSQTGLYKALARIRKNLHECVQTKLVEEGLV